MTGKQSVPVKQAISEKCLVVEKIEVLIDGEDTSVLWGSLVSEDGYHQPNPFWRPLRRSYESERPTSLEPHAEKDSFNWVNRLIFEARF